MSTSSGLADVLLLEKIQRLLAEGGFVATYKFAVLLGLTDLASESWSGRTGYSQSFTTSSLAEKVAALYWPQVQPIVPWKTGNAMVLKQNTGRQAAIANLLSRLRELHARGGTSGFISRVRTTSVSGLRRKRKGKGRPGNQQSRAWSILDEIEWTLIRYPLPRLQRFPTGDDPFLYSIDWTVEDTDMRESQLRQRWLESRKQGQGGLVISMKPGVVTTLARFQGILRDLVEARWVRMIRMMNPDVREEPDLHDHLFGLHRSSTDTIRAPILNLQRGLCFYCASRIRRGEIDHFVPWALSRNDRIENLVAACKTCNSLKKDHLAAERHLARWLSRMKPASESYQSLVSAASETDWPQGRQATLSLTQLLYRRPPAPEELWLEDRRFVTWDPGRARDLIVKASELAIPAVAEPPPDSG